MPDLDNAEAFLLNFHARFAGATSDAMSHCARDGRSPYEEARNTFTACNG
jgi:hypothetical protein